MELEVAHLHSLLQYCGKAPCTMTMKTLATCSHETHPHDEWPCHKAGQAIQERRECDHSWPCTLPPRPLNDKFQTHALILEMTNILRMMVGAPLYLTQSQQIMDGDCPKWQGWPSSKYKFDANGSLNGYFGHLLSLRFFLDGKSLCLFLSILEVEFFLAKWFHCYMATGNFNGTCDLG